MSTNSSESLFNDPQWLIYKGNGTTPHDDINQLPPPPPWRRFSSLKENFTERNLSPMEDRDDQRGLRFITGFRQIQLINTALYLRRPLLVTGKPGTGKSSLAYSVARELKLGPVLVWPITNRVTLQDGLYRYDAIGRLQDTNLGKRSPSAKPPGIEDYLTLGPLGTAFLPSKKPRVLLIDEIDKSDIDLPNNLLNIFEEGKFKIEELVRLTRENKGSIAIKSVDTSNEEDRVEITDGWIRCASFPFVVMTSNGERDFPPAFLRRCIRLEMPVPDEKRLYNIVQAHFPDQNLEKMENLISQFARNMIAGSYSTDQLLNAIYLTLNNIPTDQPLDNESATSSDSYNTLKTLGDAVMRSLDGEL